MHIFSPSHKPTLIATSMCFGGVKVGLKLRLADIRLDFFCTKIVAEVFKVIKLHSTVLYV